MKQTINQSQFIDAFRQWDTYKDNFSYNGLVALYEYLTEYEEGTGEELELDVVAICCDFREYESLEELNKEYDKDYTLDEVRDKTTVIELPSRMVEEKHSNELVEINGLIVGAF